MYLFLVIFPNFISFLLFLVKVISKYRKLTVLVIKLGGSDMNTLTLYIYTNMA